MWFLASSQGTQLNSCMMIQMNTSTGLQLSKRPKKQKLRSLHLVTHPQRYPCYQLRFINYEMKTYQERCKNLGDIHVSNKSMHPDIKHLQSHGNYTPFRCWDILIFFTQNSMTSKCKTGMKELIGIVILLKQDMKCMNNIIFPQGAQILIL